MQVDASQSKSMQGNAMAIQKSMKLLYGHTEMYLHNTLTISWNFHPELSLEFLFENTVWAQENAH